MSVRRPSGAVHANAFNPSRPQPRQITVTYLAVPLVDSFNGVGVNKGPARVNVVHIFLAQRHAVAPVQRADVVLSIMMEAGKDNGALDL